MGEHSTHEAGHRETKKEKSPVAHRAFPVLSPVKASCAKKSVTTANGQRGKTEAPHISRGGLPSGCGKKVTFKGAGTRWPGSPDKRCDDFPRHRLVPPYGTQKPRRSPPCPGLFLNRPTSWPSGRTWLRPSLVGAIAVAQGGLASGLSAGWPPGPDRETLSIAELTDHHRLRSHAEREMRRCHGPSEREHAHHQATARCHTGPADSSDTHRMS